MRTFSRPAALAIIYGLLIVAISLMAVPRCFNRLTLGGIIIVLLGSVLAWMERTPEVESNQNETIDPADSMKKLGKQMKAANSSCDPADSMKKLGKQMKAANSFCAKTSEAFKKAREASEQTTIDKNNPNLKRGTDEAPVAQSKVYLVLSDEEISKSYIKPFRKSYKHLECGCVTTMGEKLAATYARDPWFYGGTYCCQCCMHRPLNEFTWEPDGESMDPSLWTEEEMDRVVKAKQEAHNAR